MHGIYRVIEMTGISFSKPDAENLQSVPSAACRPTIDGRKRVSQRKPIHQCPLRGGDYPIR